MKIKLETIAKKLNISETTVSRALRNNPAISEETRERVIETASSLGYKIPYTHKGRSSYNKKAALNIITLISGSEHLDSRGSITHRMVKGISDILNSFNGNLTLDFINPDKAPDEAFYSKLKAFDGTLLLHNIAVRTVEKISLASPCVSINYQYDLPYVDNVSAKDLEHMIFMVRHLKEKGHRRIGYIDVNKPHPRIKERYLGFLMGLEESGLDKISAIKDELYPEYDMKFAAAFNETKNKNITAWVCGNDPTAIGFAEFLKTKKIKVPADLSLTGFGGVAPETEGLNICTFDIPFEELGREAAKHLIDRIKLPGTASRQTLVTCRFTAGNTVKQIS